MTGSSSQKRISLNRRRRREGQSTSISINWEELRLAKTLEDASTQSADQSMARPTATESRSKRTITPTRAATRISSRRIRTGRVLQRLVGRDRKPGLPGRKSGRDLCRRTLPYPFLTSGYNTSSTGVVETDVASNTTTVTDQTGKVRRSATDSLGRLVESMSRPRAASAQLLRQISGRDTL